MNFTRPKPRARRRSLYSMIDGTMPILCRLYTQISNESFEISQQYWQITLMVFVIEFAKTEIERRRQLPAGVFVGQQIDVK